MINILLNKAFLFNTLTYYIYSYYSNLQKICFINKTNCINKYEYNNCIERWILSVLNSNESINLDLFLKYQDSDNIDIFDINNEYNQKLISEIYEKSRPSNTKKTQEFVANLLINIKNLIIKCSSTLDDAEINKLINKFVNLSTDATNLMMLDSSKLDSDKQKHIVILKLIYEALAQNQSQQWSAPLKLYKYLYDEYNLRYEGFASPFNSKLLKIGKDGKYCSLFYEPIDKYYNSIGTFFNTEFPPDSTWYINPPFIVKIFEKVWEKLKKELKQNKLLIFLNLPDWNDMSIIEPMNQSEWLISKILLRKNTYYYEAADKRITARFNSYLWVFSSNPEIKSIDESAIIKAFSV